MCGKQDPFEGVLWLGVANVVALSALCSDTESGKARKEDHNRWLFVLVSEYVSQPLRPIFASDSCSTILTVPAVPMMY